MAGPKGCGDSRSPFLTPSDISKPPYEIPNGVVKMLSLGMKMESLCASARLPGLSAPQIGVDWNFIVCWENYPSNPASFLYLFDCEYEGVGERMLSVEGCPSLPGRRFGVMRFPSVRVLSKTLRSDDSGRISISEVDRVFSGVAAAILQHEIDHMRGIFIDIGEEIYTR